MKSSPLINLLFAGGLPSTGYQFQQVSLAARDGLADALLARTDALVSEGPSLRLVEAENDHTVYLVTLPGHFAHPSILQRTLVETGGERGVVVSGVTAAAAETMAVWMAQFETQDKLMRSS